MQYKDETCDSLFCLVWTACTALTEVSFCRDMFQWALIRHRLDYFHLHLIRAGTD